MKVPYPLQSSQQRASIDKRIGKTFLSFRELKSLTSLQKRPRVVFELRINPYIKGEWCIR